MSNAIVDFSPLWQEDVYFLLESLSLCSTRGALQIAVFAHAERTCIVSYQHRIRVGGAFRILRLLTLIRPQTLPNPVRCYGG